MLSQKYWRRQRSVMGGQDQTRAGGLVFSLRMEGSVQCESEVSFSNYKHLPALRLEGDRQRRSWWLLLASLVATSSTTKVLRYLGITYLSTYLR